MGEESNLGQNLGTWSVIDIETTGADAGRDHIIDVGYLRFEDFQLVEKYSSLCRYDEPLSHFIKNSPGSTRKCSRRHQHFPPLRKD